MVLVPPGSFGQETTPTTVTTPPTVTESQSFTLQVPPPPTRHVTPQPPATVALPNRSLATPATGPLPRTLAYTGTNPLPLIFGGLLVIMLSLAARRWTRARLRARAGF